MKLDVILLLNWLEVTLWQHNHLSKTTMLANGTYQPERGTCHQMKHVTKYFSIKLGYQGFVTVTLPSNLLYIYITIFQSSNIHLLESQCEARSKKT